MDREELAGLEAKVKSGTCTPLELFNIKMYASIHSMGKENFAKFVDKQIKEEEELLKSKKR